MCQAVLTEDLNMQRVSASFVSRVSAIEQKEHCLLQEAETDQNFIEGIITGDQTWVYGYDPETKRQSSQWKSPKSPRPKKARQVHSKLIVFFDMEGILHYEYVLEGRTVNQH
jgi:hypothetical protein